MKITSVKINTEVSIHYSPNFCDPACLALQVSSTKCCRHYAEASLARLFARVVYFKDLDCRSGCLVLTPPDLAKAQNPVIQVLNDNDERQPEEISVRERGTYMFVTMSYVLSLQTPNIYGYPAVTLDMAAGGMC